MAAISFDLLLLFLLLKVISSFFKVPFREQSLEKRHALVAKEEGCRSGDECSFAGVVIPSLEGLPWELRG